MSGKTVAVLGCGTQGQAHALNLRDAGANVLIGQRLGGRGEQLAREAGFEPRPVGDVVASADLIIFGLPDESMGAIFEADVRPALRDGQTLGFLHGFAIHYGRIKPPSGVDVVLVAPKGQGRAVRALYQAGRGVAALIAVAQDSSGSARRTALAWCAGIGAHHAGILETTFGDETETDLFGEQAVLCGGLSALIKAAFETLVEAGYPAELAYFECCHEVKLIADLLQVHGITGTRERISNTARFGDLTRGPRVVDERVREKLREILSEIRSGAFAREWVGEHDAGKPQFMALTDRDREHPIETTGARIRKMMGLDGK